MKKSFGRLKIMVYVPSYTIIFQEFLMYTFTRKKYLFRIEMSQWTFLQYDLLGPAMIRFQWKCCRFFSSNQHTLVLLSFKAFHGAFHCHALIETTGYDLVHSTLLSWQCSHSWLSESQKLFFSRQGTNWLFDIAYLCTASLDFLGGLPYRYQPGPPQLTFQDLKIRDVHELAHKLKLAIKFCCSIIPYRDLYTQRHP